MAARVCPELYEFGLEAGLNALGNELLADEESSYLDKARSTLAIPDTVSNDTRNKDEVLMGEFGRLQVPL